jgi:hypothetical protein
MFNPFYPLTNELLNAFVANGKIFFVRQNFERGRNILDNNIREYFLITHYESLTTAMDHYGAISYDRRRFLYHWDNEEHRRKLEIAASSPEGFKIFAAVLKPGWDRPADRILKNKIRRYIEQIGWNPKRDQGVLTNYELQFGELYIRIKYQGREAKVKFEEIENLS